MYIMSCSIDKYVEGKYFNEIYSEITLYQQPIECNMEGLILHFQKKTLLYYSFLCIYNLIVKNWQNISH